MDRVDVALPTISDLSHVCLVRLAVDRGDAKVRATLML